MASRKSSRSGNAERPTIGVSLKEQLLALPELQPKPAPARAPAPPRVPVGPSFRQLAGDVVPFAPDAPAPPRAAPPEAPAQAPPRRSDAVRPRLWVDRHAGAVRARADDVPVRLVRELESGRIVPRRELDLHRLSALEGRQVLDVGIRQARREGISCVLVLCGRGLHSGAGGPVLPDLVIERLSEELAGEVLAFVSAPRKWGGDGALLVWLRPAAATPEG